jgi:predicted TIM-barrel fold metal-dependent hydrolase
MQEHLRPLAPTRPQNRPPAGAVDCHAHIFGPLDRFPVGEDRSYDAVELPAERYLETLDALGLAGGVVVTASAYGTDNRALTHALSAFSARLRGVAVVDGGLAPDDLVAMRDAGVRGLRFTQLSDRVPEFQGTVAYDALRTLAPAMRELGLHAQLWTLCDLFAEQHRELLELEIPLVLDHMGLFDPSRGTADPAFRTLLELLAEGRVWVKLIPYRMSSNYPDYGDLRPFHEAMLEANADRLLWGTDWPHVRMTENMPDDGHLLDLLLEWTADDELAGKVLVDNPSRLYGFPRP